MVTIRADEISNIIRERIEQYNREVKIVNTGIVLQVGDGIARIYGLDEVMAGELVEFEEGTIGIELPTKGSCCRYDKTAVTLIYSTLLECDPNCS